ncbi:unnamed protein product [Microthlaspi erraticum]|uniref:Neprosin domain-containing protein n=1 Tax=Microthlaspi erraticum TaxID=1685480 RepID=A0A6D2HR87_9BRAS|nr:unnamed protein product [Microthlaspi erraticum]
MYQMRNKRRILYNTKAAYAVYGPEIRRQWSFTEGLASKAFLQRLGPPLLYYLNQKIWRRRLPYLLISSTRSKSASLIEWGGEVMDSQSDGYHMSTQMESASKGLNTFTKKSNWYDAQTGSTDDLGHYFYYGGLEHWSFFNFIISSSVSSPHCNTKSDFVVPLTPNYALST